MNRVAKNLGAFYYAVGTPANDSILTLLLFGAVGFGTWYLTFSYAAVIVSQVALVLQGMVKYTCAYKRGLTAGAAYTNESWVRQITAAADAIQAGEVGRDKTG